MTTTSRTGSKPPSPPPKTEKTKDKSKDKDKDKDQADQDALDQAVGSLSIMMLQKILQGTRQRRAQMNEDDTDAF